MEKILSILIIFLTGVVASSVQAQTTYMFVFLNSRTDKPELPKEELEKIMEGHLVNMERLARENKLLVAGPFEGGGGIFILNTNSEKEATKWISTDPGIQNNRWSIELLPISFSIGSVCVAADTAEMVMYHFVRFTSHITKFNVKTSTATIKMHDDFIKNLNNDIQIIGEGIFSDRAGSILIIKDKIDKEIFESSPAVTSTLYSVEVKELWIAKGSFCEK